MQENRSPAPADAGTADRPLAWRLVVPVKASDRAKSRLAAPAGTHRPALAQAIALDVLDATLGCPYVGELVVVTDDATVRGWATGRAIVVDDPARGLDEAVRRGAAGSAGPVAVLLGDVAAVRPDDLTDALAACAAYRSAVVPDAEGTGTVLLTALTAEDLRPRFGRGSAARHEGAGARRLDLDLPRLRRDVDTAEELAEALRLGAGPRTSALLSAAG